MIIEAMKSSASTEFKDKISKEAIKGYQAMVLDGYKLKLGDKAVSVDRFVIDEVPYKTQLANAVAKLLAGGSHESKDIIDQAINRYTYDAIEEYCVENDIKIE